MNYLELTIYLLTFYLIFKNLKTNRIYEKMTNTDKINSYLEEQYKIGNIRNFYKKLDNFKKGIGNYENITIDGNLTINRSFNQLPKNSILPYFGIKIPDGWTLCNGRNGTPDLRSRFIIGEGKNSDTNISERTKGDTGGTEVEKLEKNQMPKHKHTCQNNNPASHTHATKSNNEAMEYWNSCSPCHKKDNAQLSGSYNDCGRSQSVTWGESGDHKHEMETVGGNKPHNNMPPFFVLTFIMKL